MVRFLRERQQAEEAQRLEPPADEVIDVQVSPVAEANGQATRPDASD